MPARPKTYHGGLPQPDSLGRWRPVVGRTQDGKPARFQVGTRKTSKADALKRLEAIRDLYDRQCAELGSDYWLGWVQCWAVKLAQGIPVVVHASSAATSNPGQAAEELSIVRQLQAWGAPIIIADDLPQLGYVALRQQIDQTVQQAVQIAVEELRSRWRGGVVEEAEQHTALPADPKTAPAGTHRDKLTLMDSTFPHTKPQMVYWNVQSELDGEAMIEITYFTSGISWSAVFRKVGEPGVVVEVNSSVVGWNDHTLYSQRVRNYTKKPIDLEVRRGFPGDVVFRSDLAAKNHDFQTIEYTATVKPAEKVDLLYEINQHQGRNAKQNNVTIELAPVKP